MALMSRRNGRALDSRNADAFNAQFLPFRELGDQFQDILFCRIETLRQERRPMHVSVKAMRIINSFGILSRGWLAVDFYKKFSGRHGGLAEEKGHGTPKFELDSLRASRRDGDVVEPP